MYLEPEGTLKSINIVQLYLENLFDDSGLPVQWIFPHGCEGQYHRRRMP